MKNNTKNNSILKSYFQYVSLNVLGIIGLTCYILADTIFVSLSMGIEGLSALSLALPVFNLINGFGLMIGMGTGTRYSITRDKNKESDKLFSNGLFFTTFLGIIFIICGIFFSKNLATLFGADAHTIDITSRYMQVIMIFAPAFMINNLLLCMVRNDGNPTLAMIAMVVGSLSNIVFDYLFIFPCQMGIFGAALATGFSPLISMAIIAIHFIKKKNKFHFVLTKPSFKKLFNVCAVGSFSFITEFSTGLVILIFNNIILGISGNVGVASYSIIANISLVVFCLFTGISQGVQPLISLNYGESNYGNIKKLLKYSLISIIALSLIVYLIILFFNKPIINIFNSENSLELFEITKKGLLVYFTSTLFVGMNIFIASFLSSIDKSRNSFIISLLRGLILIIPIAFIASHFLGLLGVWLTFPITESLVFILSITLFIYTRKKLKF